MPDVAGSECVRCFRDPLPDGIDFEWERDPFPFWAEVIESRPVIGRPPWEDFEAGPGEVAYWYRFDEPPLTGDGSLDIAGAIVMCDTMPGRSEEHTSELQSLMRISYAVFCLKKKQTIFLLIEQPLLVL